MTRFSVHVGDMLSLDVDAIVNPANSSLQGRGGLSGDILATGGPDLVAACKALRLCPPGQAVITPGFGLRSRMVIHAVGPQWHGGTRQESEVLSQCYQAILARALENGIQRLAIPAISTGIFGYPLGKATEVAVRAVTQIAPTAGLTEVIFACWNEEAAEAYRDELGRSR